MKANMKNTIHSTDYNTVVAKEFEVLLDADRARGPVVGLKVDPIDSEPFIMPIDFESAKELALTIFKTLLIAAPELFA